MYDIAHFNRVSDYLPIFVGALMTDMVFLANKQRFASKQLIRWYDLFGLSAVIADTLIIVIGIVIARFFYYRLFKSFSLLKFCGLAVVIQVVHDLLFAVMFQNVPRGYSRILDVFKDYAKEKGFGILLADAAMIVSTCLLSSWLGGLSLNTNIIALILTVYTVPYFLYK